MGLSCGVFFLFGVDWVRIFFLKFFYEIMIKKWLIWYICMDFVK